MTRESMQFDVVIVGAGPAGLATAIRLKQLCQQHEHDFSICVIEKGASVGAHILSGAVLEPRTLDELLPAWRTESTFTRTPVKEDHFIYLSKKRSWRLPTPPPMRNEGNEIIKLSHLCRWLAEQAQALGVEIYPGFAAAEILYDEQDRVYGIATGDMGVGKDGNPTANYQQGMELHAKQTILAEGCRGSLTQTVFEHFGLREGIQPQTYGLGIKELWEVDSALYSPGKVIHTIGWPLDHKTYGGSFIYHLQDNQVAVGFVVGLDYENPYLNPFEEMQRFKTHPAIKPLFENGKRLGYGARALNEGGWQSIPKLTFPGGLIVGDSAGFLNVPKIKGIHTAMKSGMVAAEILFDALQLGHAERQELINYSENLQQSWMWEELYRVRNIRPAFRKGLWPGLAYAALETYVLHGREPWTFNQHADNLCLKKAKDCKPIAYPKSDGVITFDKLSSVYLSNTYHAENQPAHLTLKNAEIPIAINLKEYAAPEQYYCPANVYEVIYNLNKEPRLQINAQNCIHCKTCDIKDPKQNIVWVTPQGGEGPNYTDM